MNKTIILDKKMAEIIGALYGDGNLWSNNRKYEVSFTGDPKKDLDYFGYLNKILSKKLSKKLYFRTRKNGLRLTIYSKIFYQFLTLKLKIPSGELKSTSSIPRYIRSNNLFMKKFIRGIFDTDGSIFTSNKPGSQNYPSIEITNKNKSLVFQIYNFLISSGFRANLRVHKEVYKISVYGYKMMRKWEDEIGMSNASKLSRMESILKHSY